MNRRQVAQHIGATRVTGRTPLVALFRGVLTLWTLKMLCLPVSDQLLSVVHFEVALEGRAVVWHLTVDRSIGQANFRLGPLASDQVLEDDLQSHRGGNVQPSVPQTNLWPFMDTGKGSRFSTETFLVRAAEAGREGEELAQVFNLVVGGRGRKDGRSNDVEKASAVAGAAAGPGAAAAAAAAAALDNLRSLGKSDHKTTV